MDTVHFNIRGFWVALVAVAVVWSPPVGESLAQSGSPPANSNSSSAGSDQNRDAGGEPNRRERGGRYGGRERQGRGQASGNRDGSSSPGGVAAAQTTSAPATTPVPEVSEAERTCIWAKELIQKHDKNGDMMLQESEWEGLGQSTRADANGNKVITLNELLAFASRKPGTPAVTIEPGTTTS